MTTAADLLYEIETEILLNIARLLGKGAVATADWKLKKLAQLGALRRENIAVIQKYRDAVAAQSDLDISKSAFDQLLKTDTLFQRAEGEGATILAALPADADPVIREIVARWQLSARSAYNITIQSLLVGADDIFRETLEMATTQYLVGESSGREALRSVCDKWLENGGIKIIDKGNHRWSAEGYASMVMRTNVRRATTEVTMARTQEYGADLIEVSSHSGARPLCAPYQGRVFSLSGNSDTYPALSTTSYGEAAGLFGINCGHNSFPFFEGISRQTYSPDETEEEVAANAKAYKESQQQRQIERGIRAAKRREQFYQAAGDEDGAAEARAVVKKRQASMRDFIDKTGRTRRRDREQIS